MESEFESLDDDVISSSYAWMLTFSDLLLLLLTLFVLKLSMSAIDGSSLFRALSYFDLHGSKTASHDGTRLSNELQVRSFQPTPKGSRLLAAISDAVQQSDGEIQGTKENGGEVSIGNSVRVIPLEAGVSIEFASPFPNSGVELSFRVEKQLRAIIFALRNDRLRYSISAYSPLDDAPNSEFPSAWELTAEQARSVARQIIDAGVEPQSISVFGYGDSKVFPVEKKALDDYQRRILEIRVTPLDN